MNSHISILRQQSAPVPTLYCIAIPFSLISLTLPLYPSLFLSISPVSTAYLSLLSSLHSLSFRSMAFFHTISQSSLFISSLFLHPFILSISILSIWKLNFTPPAPHWPSPAHPHLPSAGWNYGGVWGGVKIEIIGKLVENCITQAVLRCVGSKKWATSQFLSFLPNFLPKKYSLNDSGKIGFSNFRFCRCLRNILICSW